MPKSKGSAPKPAKSGGILRGVFRFFWLRPVRYLIFIVLIAVLVYWQRQNIAAWVNGVVTGTLQLFGWGLLIALAALTAFVIITQRFPLSSILRKWNYVIAVVLALLGAWGILALFPGPGVMRETSLGGTIGRNIAGQTGAAGILRIVAMFALASILAFPRAWYRGVAASFTWAFNTLKKVRLPKPARRKAAPPPGAAAATPAAVSQGKPVASKTAEPAPVTGTAPTEAQQELKQVAQDVWKKYGEAPNLTIVDGWRLPPIDILERSPEVQLSQADNMQRARLIEEALASYGVEARVVQINTGPTVTQFGVEPGWDRKIKEIKEKDRDGNVRVRSEEIAKTRVKVDRITSLANDLALALAAPSIRIEAPVPGKSVVGIEVPNTISSMVSLRGVIETSAFQKALTRSKLALALGKGAGGEAVAADLTKMPHLLIAGATGSGKTVCLNTIICCLLLNNTPNDVKFIMIDPKRVELTSFNGIPHLAGPVIVDAEKAIEALRWLGAEMDNRYKKMATVSARNIEAYNRNRQGNERMNYLVLVIDELADLMMLGGDEVERILCRLAQLARAVGIHLVVATQRPSVDVVTGLIKANFPTRISFAVTSQVDSRTILDMVGAEKLLGKGDMLYMPTEADKPKRLQGCYVSDAETERLVFFWGNQHREDTANPSLRIEDMSLAHAGHRFGAPPDPMLEEARAIAREHKQISASYLQRRLRIGYPRAARLMEELEAEQGGAAGEEGKEKS